MKLPENVVPMPAEQRAELKQLAEQATPGPWSAGHLSDDNSTCNCPWVMSAGLCGSICTIDVDNGLPIGEGGNDSPPLAEAKANQRYIAAVSPDITLATLSYVEALEAEVARLAGDLQHYNKVLGSSRTLGSKFTHAEIANKVRMLTRSDLDHEMVCMLGRDRIILLANELAEATSRATKAEKQRDLWRLEAKAHAARFAVLAAHDEAPYCEGQCGICTCQESSTPPPSSPAAAGTGVASEFFLNGDPSINPFGPR